MVFMPRPLLVVSILFLGSPLFLTAAVQQTQAAAPKTSTSSKTATAKTGTVTKRFTTTSTKKPLVLTTQKDKQSYAIGLNVGKNLTRDSVDVDPNILLQGLKDALAGGKLLLTDDEVKATMMALQQDVRQKMEAKRLALMQTNKTQGEAFLAANSKKDGVVTLPSGLQYKILTQGSGPKPSATDSVECNYRGTLIDNTEFDSSYKRGQPATFGVSQVIKGWTEALQLMPAGSKWQLFIPPDLAYGERGQGGVIGPNATLVFEVELLSIKPKDMSTTPTPDQSKQDPAKHDQIKAVQDKPNK